MRAASSGGKFFVFGSALALIFSLAPSAHATQTTKAPHAQQHVAPRKVASNYKTSHSAAVHNVTSHTTHGRVIHAKYSRNSAPHFIGISCVPYAREASGIDLSGNAFTWWDHAEGRYARGSAPEAGSVLAFRANSSMRLGHVAVVQRVVNPREIIIDHANWGGPGAGRGRISTGIPVVDVSPMNDWSAVRVGLGRSGEFGSVYPTYGFIYDRPDSGKLMASNTPAIPALALNPAPRDLRPAGQRAPMPVAGGYAEVAEAPANAVNNVVYGSLRTDAPNRNIR